MVSHRSRARTSVARPEPVGDGRASRAAASGQSVEEGFAPSVDVFPKPDGFGTEASTSSSTFVLLDEYVVPDGHVARLREASLSIEGNGEAKISVAGTTYGPFTGSVDVAVPLDDSVLPAGYHIRVHHQSTDGTSTTTKTVVVALEI